MAFFTRRRRKEVAIVSSPVEGTVHIGSAPRREKIRVCGQVVRMRLQPADALPVLVLSIRDSSGTALVQWKGRSSIPGIALGRQLIVEGVGYDTEVGLTFDNPAYELLSS
jgi:hypothetical protein